MSSRILFVPSVRKGNGSGHLVRAFSLARALGPGAAIFIPGGRDEARWSPAELSLAYARELEGLALISEEALGASWNLVVLDQRETSLEELAFWEGLGLTVAVDEGGPARRSAHYLIDILPRADKPGEGQDCGPNKASRAFLDLPKKRRLSPPTAFRRVLLSFGGEDPAGLGLQLARELLGRGLVEAASLTLVGGALSRQALAKPGEASGLEGCVVLGPVQDLKEHLHQFDLVFTSFGLTAFEAAWAGAAVVLLNPSPYHRKLSLAAGFPEIGVGKPDGARLAEIFRNPASVIGRSAALFSGPPESLAAHIAGLKPSGPRFCPACGGGERQALFRNETRSFFRCSSCGMIYLSRFSPGRETPYTREYFFEEYKRQYGRTYLEDWPQLTGLSLPRLKEIEAVSRRSLGRSAGLSILDVGCAYGPFLAAAKERGHEPYGLDIAEDAAQYVSTELGIPVGAGDFADPSAALRFGRPFDALCLWYVIEHFEDLDQVLRNAASLLRPGGVLAFSTPSGEGVSGRFSPAGFFAKSPEDHFTVWEPSRTRAILRAYGFRVERIKSVGHHPERFPGYPKPRSPLLAKALMRLGLLFSRLLRLGDSFEVYAVRLEDAAVGRGDPKAEDGLEPRERREGRLGAAR